MPSSKLVRIALDQRTVMKGTWVTLIRVAESGTSGHSTGPAPSSTCGPQESRRRPAAQPALLDDVAHRLAVLLRMVSRKLL